MLASFTCNRGWENPRRIRREGKKCFLNGMNGERSEKGKKTILVAFVFLEKWRKEYLKNFTRGKIFYSGIRGES